VRHTCAHATHDEVIYAKAADLNAGRAAAELDQHGAADLRLCSSCHGTRSADFFSLARLPVDMLTMSAVHSR
jgi:cytochrome c553